MHPVSHIYFRYLYTSTAIVFTILSTSRLATHQFSSFVMTEVNSYDCYLFHGCLLTSAEECIAANKLTLPILGFVHSKVERIVNAVEFEFVKISKSCVTQDMFFNEMKPLGRIY